MTNTDVMQSTGMARIVPLREAHLDQVLDIEAQTSPAGWTRAIFRNELARPDTRCYLIAELADHVVGFAGVQLMAGEAHITTVAVARSHRRRKLATRLLVALLREARARGAHAATLEVRLHNRAAQRLYATVGFRPVGVRPKYYDGSDDAIIMWAHDIDTPAFGATLDALDAQIASATDMVQLPGAEPGRGGGR